MFEIEGDRDEPQRCQAKITQNAALPVCTQNCCEESDDERNEDNLKRSLSLHAKQHITDRTRSAVVMYTQASGFTEYATAHVNALAPTRHDRVSNTHTWAQQALGHTRVLTYPPVCPGTTFISLSFELFCEVAASSSSLPPTGPTSFRHVLADSNATDPVGRVAAQPLCTATTLHSAHLRR